MNPEMDVTPEDAEFGSVMLLEAIAKVFWKFAWKYGISEDEARHLLLNTGVRL